MQRVLVVVLLGIFALALTACGGEAEHYTVDPNDPEPTVRAIELTAEALLGDGSEEANSPIAGDTTGEAADDIAEGAAGSATATPDAAADDGSDEEATDAATATPDEAADDGSDEEATEAATATPDEAADEGSDEEVTPAADTGGDGDPAEGEALFAAATFDGAPGCAACHSLEAGVRLAGPSLAGVGDRAASMEEGLAAEEYVLQSIVEPNAIVVQGFPPVMPQNYGDVLSDEELSHLVAFLLTQ